nr:TPA_asm: hypothetical protein HUJ06_020295 [Nelumbo nucifera]
MSAGDKVSMKEKQEKQRRLSVEQSAMAGVSPAVYFPSPGQPQFQTPSPFEYSIASTTWSSRHSFQVPTLVLRSLALLFSFVSALSLAAPRHGTPLNNPPLR